MTKDPNLALPTPPQLAVPSRRPRYLRWRLASSVAGLGLLALLSACGSSAAAGANSPTSTASPATTGYASASSAAGASSSGATSPSTTTAGAANRAALQAYRDCLTAHGVTLPAAPTTVAGATTVAGQGRGAGGAGGLQTVLADPANAAAVAACASVAPAGGFGSGTGSGARSQAMQAYYSCLSDNGVTVPTTVAGGAPPSIDQTSPAYAAAAQTCQALLPQRPTTTTTSAG